MALSPFEIKLNPYLKANSPIQITVLTDNRLTERAIPDTYCNGWRLYGGIIRPVLLCYRPKNRLEHVTIRTFHIQENTFDLAFSFKQIGKTPDHLSLEIITPEGQPFIRHTFKSIISDSLYKIRIHNTHPWTPETPYLYQIKLIANFDGNLFTKEFKKGFMQVTTSKNNILLNGKPYYLRGISTHEGVDNKGPLSNKQEKLADFIDLKRLNVNFLRVPHYPQPEYVYTLCDSLGILVMDEIPAWKTSPRFLGSRDGKSFATEYLSKMITTHGNYTSVALWSFGNEFHSFRSNVSNYIKHLSAYAKQADLHFRPSTYCSYFYHYDKAYEYVDIISVNEYFGWHIGDLEMLIPILKKIQKKWPDKPLIISEVGCSSQMGLRNAKAKLAGKITSMLKKDYSEDHQALYLRSHLTTLWDNRDLCQGTVVWNYTDYHTPRKKYQTKEMPPWISGFGLVNLQRKKKLAYWEVQKMYGKIKDFDLGE
ncbi:MAG: hypothetical protein HQK83_03110 [Fibrobacteria bacterium]|nr:hypothetical protein [Fibrobacteria bacterium]